MKKLTVAAVLLTSILPSPAVHRIRRLKPPTDALSSPMVSHRWIVILAVYKDAQTGKTEQINRDQITNMSELNN